MSSQPPPLLNSLLHRYSWTITTNLPLLLPPRIITYYVTPSPIDVIFVLFLPSCHHCQRNHCFCIMGSSSIIIWIWTRFKKIPLIFRYIFLLSSRGAKLFFSNNYHHIYYFQKYLSQKFIISDDLFVQLLLIVLIFSIIIFISISLLMLVL